MTFTDKMFEGKVIVGISAGAAIIAEYYLDEGSEIEKGLGLLPIKIMVHYSDDRAEELKRLQKAHGNLRTYFLAEGTYAVFTEEESEDD